MDLKAYLEGLDRGGAARLANKLGISHSYLSQLAARTSPISPARAVAIEQATHGAVSRKACRPDDWHLIWPEIVEEHSPKEAA